MQTSSDIIVIGGAMIGSAIAWHLKGHVGFSGSVLVIEKDKSYTQCSSAHTNSCIRQQFSTEVNIRISQYGAEVIRDFSALLGGHPDIPKITLDDFGYLYLAATDQAADAMVRRQVLQASLGAGTQIITPTEIAEAYPFYQLDDVKLGSLNLVNEGYFDGATMFDWWRRQSRSLGVRYEDGEVVAMDRESSRITAVQLADGRRIQAGMVVNASGPRAARTARMAGVDLPIEARKRFSFIFEAEDKFEQRMPLTIDPSGVHMRSDGANFLCGCPPDIDDAVDFDDFDMDHDIFEEKVWPAIAARVPAFERIRLLNSWAGHYAFNVFDHNAILGPHPEVDNFILANGFSGHGFQQSPAVGRGIAELIEYGSYRSLDLSSLHLDRWQKGQPIVEDAVI